jgi:hypothetical protein
MDSLQQTTKNRRWLWAKSHSDESSGPAESSHPRQKAEDISALHRSLGCISANIAYSIHNFNQGPNNSDKLLCRNSSHDHPRHLRIKPTDAVAPDHKIGWIENMRPDEIQHHAIDPRSLRLH